MTNVIKELHELQQKVNQMSESKDMPPKLPFPTEELDPAEEPPLDSKEFTRFSKWAKTNDYVKKVLEPETEADRQFKISFLTFLVLVIGDVMIFLGTVVVFNEFGVETWVITPTATMTLARSILKDLSVGLIGKMLKYYNSTKPVNE